MRKKKEHKENSERWLLTYSDLITLLMILFILMYAMSNVDQNKYQQLAQSLGQAMGNGGTSLGTGTDSILNGGAGILDGGVQQTQADQSSENSTESSSDATPTQKMAEQAEMTYVKDNLQQIINSNNLGGDIGINLKDTGLVITFPSNTFFDSAKATLKDNMKLALDKISKELNMIDNDIYVKGYTDSDPISTAAYPSNWQLSSDRAANVAQYLADNAQIKHSRLFPIGRGDNDPVAGNDTAEGKSKNRRVEISIPYTYTKAVN